MTPYIFHQRATAAPQQGPPSCPQLDVVNCMLSMLKLILQMDDKNFTRLNFSALHWDPKPHSTTGNWDQIIKSKGWLAIAKLKPLSLLISPF